MEIWDQAYIIFSKIIPVHHIGKFNDLFIFMRKFEQMIEEDKGGELKNKSLMDVLEFLFEEEVQFHTLNDFHIVGFQFWILRWLNT